MWVKPTIALPDTYLIPAASGLVQAYCIGLAGLDKKRDADHSRTAVSAARPSRTDPGRDESSASCAVSEELSALLEVLPSGTAEQCHQVEQGLTGLLLQSRSENLALQQKLSEWWAACSIFQFVYRPKLPRAMLGHSEVLLRRLIRPAWAALAGRMSQLDGSRSGQLW